MNQIPIKKFEKLSTITDRFGSIVLTKITDFKNGTVTFEVKNNGQKYLYKTLKEAQKHLSNPPQPTEKIPNFKNPTYTQARLNF